MELQALLRAPLRRAVYSPAPQLLALVATRWFHDTRLLTWAAAFLALVSLLAWVAVYARLRIASDTASSRIASAAQGYVELSGSAEQHASSPTFSKFRGLPCLWFKYQVEEKSNDAWRIVDRGVSDSTFLLRDATGVCIIDPEGAEVYTAHKEVWSTADHRYTEYLLLPKDTLFVLGAFVTINSADTLLDPRHDTGELLAEWKLNRPRLLERFDLNKDGDIDDQEWRLARAQAKREVAKQHREIRAEPGFHLLHAPTDGRPFLISNRSQEKLLRRFKFWGMFHVAAFVCACAWWGYLLQR